MAWYHDNTRQTYVTTYRDERSMRAEVEAAAGVGFVTQTMARRGNQWTVTYHRDERTWARIQVETALEQVNRERAKLDQAKGKTGTLVAEIEPRFRAARAETSNPTQLEQRLLKSITDLIAARQAANAQRRMVLASHSALKSARDAAAKLQVEVPHADINEAETATLSSEIDDEMKHLEGDQALQRAQQSVVKAAQEWQKVVGDRWGAHGKVTNAARGIAAIATPLVTAQSILSRSSDSKVQAAQTEHAKRQAQLEALDALLQQREGALLHELEARDNCVAVVLG
jgi:acyl-CoA thioesterase FadM